MGKQVIINSKQLTHNTLELFFYLFLLQILGRKLILQHERCESVDGTPKPDGKTSLYGANIPSDPV
jgi:hypothetical protein